jgi:predicted metal-dependent HD superfamily phosphohydrolase
MTHEDEPGTTSQLQAYWLRSCRSAPPETSAQVLAQVLARWSEPQRAYHTLQHLREALTLLDAWSSGGPWPDTLALALFFHDVVYDPRRSDNEDMSARLARDMLALLQLPPEQIEAVARLIDITKHAAVPHTEDEKWMVDIDLAILGAAPERYAQYRLQVRQEYAHVPEALFTRGRLAVLEAFLQARPALYHTPRGRSAFDAAAARNLAHEVAQLRAALAAGR